MKRTKQKQQASERLLLFLLIAFWPTFGVQLLYIGRIGLTTESEWYAPMVSVCMLLPAFAHFVTRVGSGESLHHTLFFMSLRKGWRCLLLALLGPVVSILLTSILWAGWLMPEENAALMLAFLATPTFWGELLHILLLSVLNIAFALGEEYGWRGYMMPKLERLMPFPAAVAVGGMVWGLWHALLIGCGHNFGLHYPGYPWTGVGMMMIFCTALGFCFTMLTKVSDSVIPAALAHILFNNLNGVLLPDVLSAGLPEGTEWSMDVSASVLTLFITSFVSIVMGLLLLSGRKNPSSPNGRRE